MGYVTVRGMNLVKPRSWTSTSAQTKYRDHFIYCNCTQIGFSNSQTNTIHPSTFSMAVLSIIQVLKGFQREGSMFVQVSEQQLPRSIHTKTLNRGNSDWSGCRRSTRKQIVPDRPSNRLQTLVTEWEPVLNSSVKRNSANLVRAREKQRIQSDI